MKSELQGFPEYVELCMVQRTCILQYKYRRTTSDYQRVTPKCLKTTAQEYAPGGAIKRAPEFEIDQVYVHKSAAKYVI